MSDTCREWMDRYRKLFKLIITGKAHSEEYDRLLAWMTVERWNRMGGPGWKEGDPESREQELIRTDGKRLYADAIKDRA